VGQDIDGCNGKEERMKAKRQTVGRYIVVDKRICHGQPIFRGTRIMVADVLEQVANGMAWEAIVAEWRGGISEEAIAEAVRLAREALITQASPIRMTGS
jgi:uncharacterized protein (DUF433 family)